MLQKVSRFFKRFQKESTIQQGSAINPCPSKSEFILSPAVDRTLTESGIKLPIPTVSEPTRDQNGNFALPNFPGYIAVEVTNVCNLRCTHCNYRYGLDHYSRERGFMNSETLLRVFEEARTHNTTILLNYDGEPLMHHNFLSYLELATDMGLNTYFNTNATLLNHQFTDDLIKFYKGSIFFSVDGNKEWFERVRVPGNFDQVIDNISYFLTANEKAGWPITTGISFCNLGQSIIDRKTFIDEWLPKVNLVSLGEVNDKFGTMISDMMIKMDVAKRPVCIVPWQTLGICHNGDVIPCSIYITRANTTGTIFGNIHDSSIEEIWKGEKFMQFRKMLVESHFQDNYCSKCERWLGQINFPDEIQGNTKISRSGSCVKFFNMKKGSLNYAK